MINTPGNVVAAACDVVVVLEVGAELVIVVVTWVVAGVVGIALTSIEKALSPTPLIAVTT